MGGIWGRARVGWGPVWLSFKGLVNPDLTRDPSAGELQLKVIPPFPTLKFLLISALNRNSHRFLSVQISVLGCGLCAYLPASAQAPVTLPKVTLPPPAWLGPISQLVRGTVGGKRAGRGPGPPLLAHHTTSAPDGDEGSEDRDATTLELQSTLSNPPLPRNH